MGGSGFAVAKDIVKRGSTAEYSPFPYLVQVLNCELWVIYALANWSSGTMFWPLTVNGVGLTITTIVFTIFFTYASSELRKSLSWKVAPLFLVACVGAYVISANNSLLTAASGRACLIFNVIMYLGPLAGIRDAIATRSTEFLPLSLGLTTIVSASLWFTFGLGIQNSNIWFPNACGIVFGAVQVLIYAWLEKFSSKKAASEPKPNDGIQLE